MRRKAIGSRVVNKLWMKVFFLLQPMLGEDLGVCG